MNRLLKVALLMALVIGLFGAYRYVSAQEEHAQRGGAPKVNVLVPAVPAIAATNHALNRTYITSGNYASTVFPAGSTAIDSPQTIQCPGTTGTCTIEAVMSVETGLTTTLGSPNNFALGAAVDGSFLDGAQYYVANTPNDGSFVTGTRSTSGSGFLHGFHTVQTFIFSNNGAPVQQYNITYHVYKP
jgi:hypothetical protein